MLTPEQLANRKSGIGGSEVAAILGLSPWRTALDVYLDKVGDGTPQVEHKRMRRGSALEPLILAEFERRMGVEIDRLPYSPEPLRSPLYPWMLANLDGRMGSDTIVEAKTSFSADGWGEDGSDEVPPYYQTQAAHYMEVTGANVCFLPALFGLDGLDWRPVDQDDGSVIWTPQIAEDADFRIYTIVRDDAFIADLIEVERAFWHDHVLARVPPDPVTAADAKKLWPRDNGSRIELPDEIAAQVEYLKELRQEIKALEVRDKAICDALKIAAGEALTLSHNGIDLATYKWQKRREYTVKETEFRVLRIK